MVAPAVATRIEERLGSTALGVSCTLARSLPQGARDARKGEVWFLGRTTRGNWSDVVDVEHRFLSGLRQSAVFAPIACPVDDDAPQRGYHRHPSAGMRGAAKPLGAQSEQGQEF